MTDASGDLPAKEPASRFRRRRAMASPAALQLWVKFYAPARPCASLPHMNGKTGARLRSKAGFPTSQRVSMRRCW